MSTDTILAPAPRQPQPAPPDNFKAGVRDALPMLLGVFPFGMVSGAVAVQAGLSAAEAMGMSLIVYAGASQLAALQLLMTGSPAWLIVVTAAVVNMRFLMYSAATAPLFRHLPWPRKSAYAFLLTDQAAIFSLAYYNRERPIRDGRYYLGSALSLWLTWHAGAAVGIYLGASTSQAGIFGFAVPMVFLTLLIPNLKDWSTVAAAVTATVVVIAGASLPMNLGLLAASVAGIIIGILVESLTGRTGENSAPAANAQEDGDQNQWP